MNDDKLPLYDVECRKSNNKERGGVKKIALIVVIITTLLTLFVAFRSWQNTEMLLSVTLKGKETTNKPTFIPPPFLDHAKTARYIAHYIDWAVISTISSQDKEMPFGSPRSVSDGPVNNGTGVPYIYISEADPFTKNLQQDPKASFSFSEAQTDYCVRKKFDTEDPRCARLTIFGEVVKVPPEEISFAKEALFTRHPEMKMFPADHHFSFHKLNISRVNLLDFFGPDHDVPLKEYFAVKN